MELGADGKVEMEDTQHKRDDIIAVLDAFCARRFADRAVISL